MKLLCTLVNPDELRFYGLLEASNKFILALDKSVCNKGSDQTLRLTAQTDIGVGPKQDFGYPLLITYELSGEDRIPLVTGRLILYVNGEESLVSPSPPSSLFRSGLDDGISYLVTTIATHLRGESGNE